MRSEEINGDEVVAGIPPGGIRDPYTIKIMICYLCRELENPVTDQELIELLGEKIVNYFLLTSTLAEMKKVGHLKSHGKGLVLTPFGRKTADELSGELPLTLCERLVKEAKDMRRNSRLASDTSTSIEKNEQGYTVHFSFHDGELNLMQLAFFAPDEQQAERIKSHLQNDYQKLYVDLIARLTE